MSVPPAILLFVLQGSFPKTPHFSWGADLLKPLVYFSGRGLPETPPFRLISDDGFFLLLCARSDSQMSFANTAKITQK